MTLHLYDAMHIARITVETDVTGRGARRIITDMLATAPGDIHIWCWDAPGSRKMRRALYPAYKSKRVAHPDNIWPLIELIKNTMRHTKALQIEHVNYEADDLIATLVRKFAKNTQVKVHSTDRDHAQLLAEFPHLIFDYQPKIKPSLIRLYKTLVGDPSDNITGIPGFGDKAWESLGSDVERHHLADAIARSDQSELLAYENLWSPRVRKWLEDEANIYTLHKMWLITGLWNVPDDQLNYVVGVPDAAKADAMLKEARH